MPCPIPNCPGGHPAPSDNNRQFPRARLAESPARDAAGPPIFREALAAMANRRPYGPPAVIGAQLDNSRRAGTTNGAGYVWRGHNSQAGRSNTGPDPGQPDDPWRRLLNR